jgi:glycosyltransferase involved in cell wall biosynthesis
MKIGIDARFYGKLGKGLGRYTQQLVKHLEMIDDANEYVIFLRRENFDEYTPSRENFTKVLADIPWYGIAEQTEFPILLRKHRLDLVHFPHFNVPVCAKKPFVVTVHDLILLRHSTHEASTLPRWLYRWKFFVYKRVLARCLRRAGHILTVSEFSKQDLLLHFPFLKEEDITVTYQANFSLEKTKNERQKIEDKEEEKPYLLYAGNAYPHKNLPRLIRAFLSLHRKDYILVLVGKKDAFYEKIRREFLDAERKGWVKFLGEVSDDNLDRLYRGARGYVFASLFEGCGLPPLEAMARGIPVMSSNTTSMPEILGDAPIYCDPMRESSIADAIRTLLDDEEVRSKCIDMGYAQVRGYSWEILAKETLTAYRRAIKQ